MATATGVRLLCVGLRCATHDFLPASIELLPPPGRYSASLTAGIQLAGLTVDGHVLSSFLPSKLINHVSIYDAPVPFYMLMVRLAGKRRWQVERKLNRISERIPVAHRDCNVSVDSGEQLWRLGLVLYSERPGSPRGRRCPCGCRGRHLGTTCMCLRPASSEGFTTRAPSRHATWARVSSSRFKARARASSRNVAQREL